MRWFPVNQWVLAALSISGRKLYAFARGMHPDRNPGITPKDSFYLFHFRGGGGEDPCAASYKKAGRRGRLNQNEREDGTYAFDTKRVEVALDFVKREIESSSKEKY